MNRYHNHHSLRCFATTLFSTGQESNRTEFAHSLIWECGRQFRKLLTKWPFPMTLLCQSNIRTFLFIYSFFSPFIEFQQSKANVGKKAFDMGPACRRIMGFINNSNAWWSVVSALCKGQLKCSREEEKMPFQLNPEAPVLYRSVSEQAVIAEKEPGK